MAIGSICFWESRQGRLWEMAMCSMPPGTLKKKFLGVTTVLFQEREDEKVIVE